MGRVAAIKCCIVVPAVQEAVLRTKQAGTPLPADSTLNTESRALPEENDTNW